MTPALSRTVSCQSAGEATGAWAGLSKVTASSSTALQFTQVASATIVHRGSNSWYAPSEATAGVRMCVVAPVSANCPVDVRGCASAGTSKSASPRRWCWIWPR